jgi:hypothetical protein
MNPFYLYLIVIIGIFAASCSQLLLKKSADTAHRSFLFSFLNWKVFLAYCILLVSMFINIIGLKNGIQVKDIPILESLGYIFVPLLTYLFMSEPLSKRKMCSIALIISGIIIFYQ